MKPYLRNGQPLAPLHKSINDVLRLTKQEAKDCRVFALGNQYNTCVLEDKGPARFAVCRRCPRRRWAELAPGAELIYSSEWKNPETEAVKVITDYGFLRVFDAKRQVFYASALNGVDAELDLPAAEVVEVWEVVRAIAL